MVPCTGKKTDLHGCSHNLFAHSEVFGWKAIFAHVKSHNVGENADHSVITEGIDGAYVEMAQKTWCDCIPPTTRGPHCRD